MRHLARLRVMNYHGPESIGSPVDRSPNTLVTRVDMSDGEIRHTAVDHSSAPHAMTRNYCGVSVRSALRTLVWARMSINPTRATPQTFGPPIPPRARCCALFPSGPEGRPHQP